MYTVLKSFATKDITGTKGKTINILNKQLADELKSIGYIADISKKDLTTAEKDKEIERLNGEILNLNNTISTLESEKEELLKKIDELSSSTSTPDANENDGNEPSTPDANENDGNEPSTPDAKNKNKASHNK